MMPQPKRRHVFLNALAFVTLATALFLLLWAGWYIIVPGPGFTRVDITFVDDQGTLAAAPPTVRPGDDVAYRVAYCVAADVPVPVTVRRAIQLQNHTLTYGMSELGYQIVQPCEDVIRVMTIPAFAHPGPYKIQVFTDLQTTPLRRVYQAWESPTFQVTK